MASDNTAKIEILTAIRQNLTASVPFDVVHRVHRQRHREAPYVFIKTAASEKGRIPEEFRESLESVAGNCSIVPDLEGASTALQAIINNLSPRRIAISDSQIVRGVVSAIATNAEILEKAPADELFDCDVGITSAQWAIAETGTLVLESGEEFARLASLVPDVHICILETHKIRRTMGEILDIVGRELNPTVTFITGPSRTSDIELTLAIGVHGPRELYVIVTNGENDGASPPSL
jgi:L-lactate dehydrogenase complex protein LldG